MIEPLTDGARQRGFQWVSFLSVFLIGAVLNEPVAGTRLLLQEEANVTAPLEESSSEGGASLFVRF
jgi:hypothetical protein